MRKKILYRFMLFILLISFSSCSDSPSPSLPQNLVQVNSFQLNISDPSGLSFHVDLEWFWTVSDKNHRVYLITQNGEILKELNIEAEDLEGITQIDEHRIAVVLEEKREVLIIDEFGEIQNRFETGITGTLNDGFEGITYLPDEDLLLIVNEKNPTFIMKIDLTGKIISSETLSLAKDFSGLFYDRDKKEIWILSEESNLIFRCNTNYEILNSYSIPDEKFEGIAIKDEIIYMVSEITGQLTQFKIE